MINRASVAEWLQERRSLRGISQVEIGKLMGVSQGTVSNWERGNTEPDEVQKELLKKILSGEEVRGVSAPIGEPEGLDSANSAGWGGQYPLDAVFVRSDQRTVREVVRRIRNHRYDLNPEFQRAFVWPEDKQSRLIESCLMRIPLPVFYVAEAIDGRIIVVDGLQRLSTFSRYLDNEFELTFSKSEDDPPHPLEGKRFNDLDLKLQERIEDTQLILYILDAKAPERAKLDIFERVNSGEPLTKQQMRNCLYNGPATRWLRDAAESDAFCEATGVSLDPKKMRDREAINRFCAFSILGWQHYGGDMDGFLAESLERMNRMPTLQLSKLRDQLEQALNLNYLLFRQHAFRKSLTAAEGSRSVLNIALFDVCSVVFGRADAERVRSRKHAVQKAVSELIVDSEFERAITYSTNSRLPVSKRFRMMEQTIGEVLA